MFGSNSIRAKNTGIGATNLWSGTHIRFPDEHHISEHARTQAIAVAQARALRAQADALVAQADADAANYDLERLRSHAAPELGSSYQSAPATLNRVLESRVSQHLSADAPTRRRRAVVPTPSQPTVSASGRKLRPSEMDVDGYATPSLGGPTISEVMNELFSAIPIRSSNDLRNWQGTDDPGPLYDYVRTHAPGHWYSFQHRESAQSNVRSIRYDLIGSMK
jgi:hypothetical protein